jgi:hypothetical protein
LEAGLAELRSPEREIGPGHNKGPPFASGVDDLSDVDELIRRLKQEGQKPPPDPAPLIEQANKAGRVADRIWNAVTVLGAEIAKGAARQVGKEIIELAGIVYLIKSVIDALMHWLP